MHEQDGQVRCRGRRLQSRAPRQSVFHEIGPAIAQPEITEPCADPIRIGPCHDIDENQADDTVRDSRFGEGGDGGEPADRRSHHDDRRRLAPHHLDHVVAQRPKSCRLPGALAVTAQVVGHRP